MSTAISKVGIKLPKVDAPGRAALHRGTRDSTGSELPLAGSSSKGEADP